VLLKAAPPLGVFFFRTAGVAVWAPEPRGLVFRQWPQVGQKPRERRLTLWMPIENDADQLPLDHVLLFDCIEFDEALRCIDVMQDAAFVAMDLDASARPDLAALFLDTYAEQTAFLDRAQANFEPFSAGEYARVIPLDTSGPIAFRSLAAAIEI